MIIQVQYSVVGWVILLIAIDESRYVNKSLYMKVWIVFLVLLICSLQQIDVNREKCPGSWDPQKQICQVCVNGFTYDEDTKLCNKGGISIYPENSKEQVVKSQSSEENTRVAFCKPAEEARERGQVRPQMLKNWPPNNEETSGNGRLLIGQVNWNKGVQWIYAIVQSKILAKALLTLYQITFCNDCPKQAYITLKIEPISTIWVYVNGVPYSFTTGIKVRYIPLPVKCGSNLIQVFLYSCCKEVPKIRLEILQNYCYGCKNSLSGFYNRDTCQCECIDKHECSKVSPFKWFDYPDCSCKCPKQASCDLPKLWHPQKCKCQCAPICCPQGLIPNEETCTCMRCLVPPPRGGCLTGELWNNSTCKCVKCQQKSCLLGQQWSKDKCKCGPCKPLGCPSGQEWNKQTCKCGPCKPLGCSAGQEWNKNTCKCALCQLLNCPLGQEWNKDTCKCGPCLLLNCTADKQWNKDTCKCVICRPLGCISGQEWNKNTCKCQPCKQLSCSTGQEWNKDTCKCGLCQPLNCPTGQDWNKDTCKCIPNCSPRGCPLTMEWNIKSCSCEKCPIRTCYIGQQWNSNICRCDTCSPLVCNVGLRWNQQSCKCQNNCQPPEQGCQRGYYWWRSKCACRQEICPSGVQCL